MTSHEGLLHVEERVGNLFDIEAFISEVREKAAALVDPYINAWEDHECFVISVSGWRERTPDEQADFERDEHIRWMAAKITYERGLEKFGEKS